MPKFALTTLGCKVNQYESAAIAQTLRQAGWSEQDGATTRAISVWSTPAA